MADWLEAVARGETPELPGEDKAALDRLNEQTYLAHRDESLSGVMAAFEASWSRSLAAIEAVPEVKLLTPCRLGWMDDDPLWHMVGANTFWHYPPHMAKIEAWLERAKSRGE
jgi:hypothetical protein